MKKTIIAALSILIVFSSNADEIKGSSKTFKNTSDLIASQTNGVKNMYNTNPEYFITSKRLQEDINFEDDLIERFSQIVELKNDYKQADYNRMMNSYFVDALKTSNRNLADYILYQSGAEIDVNLKKDSPPFITPLTAVATAFETDGGDIEYFIKLVDMGADINEVTHGFNIPLMSLAATADNYKIVLYLALSGQNVMYLDGYDFYPLDHAVRSDAYKTTILLTNLINAYKEKIEDKVIIKD